MPRPTPSQGDAATQEKASGICASGVPSVGRSCSDLGLRSTFWRFSHFPTG